MTTTSTDKDKDTKTTGSNESLHSKIEGMLAPIIKKYPDLKFLNSTAGEIGTALYICCYSMCCLIFMFLFIKKFHKKRQPRYYSYY